MGRPLVIRCSGVRTGGHAHFIEGSIQTNVLDNLIAQFPLRYGRKCVQQVLAFLSTSHGGYNIVSMNTLSLMIKRDMYVLFNECTRTLT